MLFLGTIFSYHKTAEPSGCLVAGDGLSCHLRNLHPGRLRNLISDADCSLGIVASRRMLRKRRPMSTGRLGPAASLVLIFGCIKVVICRIDNACLRCHGGAIMELHAMVVLYYGMALRHDWRCLAVEESTALVSHSKALRSHA